MLSFFITKTDNTLVGLRPSTVSLLLYKKVKIITVNTDIFFNMWNFYKTEKTISRIPVYMIEVFDPLTNASETFV